MPNGQHYDVLDLQQPNARIAIDKGPRIAAQHIDIIEKAPLGPHPPRVLWGVLLKILEILPMTIDRYIQAIESVAEVLEERGEDYGTPYSNHTHIAHLWSVLLGQDISPHQVVMCMVALKLARLMNQPTHDDSWRDIIGYGGIGRGVADFEKEVADAVEKTRRG